jgi:hypothetical protein
VGSIPASRTTFRLVDKVKQLSMTAPYLPDTLAYWAYRVSAYVVLNLGEDAALVAIMFC